MLSRRESLRELIRRQHEESMQCQQRRDEEFRSLTEDMREFNREILLRNEKVYKAVIAEVEEGRKQIQANTKAVLSVLDRLEGSSGAATA
jgi:ATP-dependent Zn protease